MHHHVNLKIKVWIGQLTRDSRLPPSFVPDRKATLVEKKTTYSDQRIGSTDKTTNENALNGSITLKQRHLVTKQTRYNTIITVALNTLGHTQSNEHD